MYGIVRIAELTRFSFSVGLKLLLFGSNSSQSYCWYRLMLLFFAFRNWVLAVCFYVGLDKLFVEIVVVIMSFGSCWYCCCLDIVWSFSELDFFIIFVVLLKRKISGPGRAVLGWVDGVIVRFCVQRGKQNGLGCWC